MRLPFVNYQTRAVQKQLGTFKGYNRKLVIEDNEFHDMQNMTSDYFPAIGTRKGRGGTVMTLAKPNGLFYKNGLVYVDGTELYYQNKKVGEVADSKKQIIGMGAYILVWPDKIYYNTHTDEFGQMELTYTQSAAITFEPVSDNSAFTKIIAANLPFSQYDSITIEGCSNGDMNKTTIIQDVQDDHIIITAVLDEAFTQNAGITITRKVPQMDFVCENNNRIWGCSSENHEIYCCKLGDPMNWNSFEGISTDSYAVTVGSDGDFTGCVAHLGNILFFKEETIHKIMGNKPANFQINTYTLPGVGEGCENSVCVINETLYYKGRKGIYTYDGSTPRLLSEAFGNEVYTGAVADQYDEKYYVSLKDSKGQYTLMVYDPMRGMWHKEDDTDMIYTAYGDGELYYLTAENEIRTIAGDDSEEEIEWMLESGEMLESTLNMKYVSKLMFHLKLEIGAKVEIYMQYDSEPLWERKFTIHSATKQSYLIPIIPKRCSQFKYRLVGRGKCRMFGISKYVEEGSEMHG